MSIIKHVTLQKIVAHDFRYGPRTIHMPNCLKIYYTGIISRKELRLRCPNVPFCSGWLQHFKRISDVYFQVSKCKVVLLSVLAFIKHQYIHTTQSAKDSHQYEVQISMCET